MLFKQVFLHLLLDLGEQEVHVERSILAGLEQSMLDTDVSLYPLHLLGPHIQFGDYQHLSGKYLLGVKESALKFQDMFSKTYRFTYL